MFAPETKILIVDDMSTMRKLVTKTCQSLGFSNFIDAADGSLAWETLTNSEEKIGLIISDWNMPNCSGIDFLKRVRSDSRFKHLPFILVTAEAEKHQIVEAISSGVSGYVIKPFTAEALGSKLEEAHKRIVK
jgi:two-component system chemotaxis response regulator CheY